ncbi:tyrosine--tRNA ligase [Anaerorhabdus furcosa]|uniref:Tyrosine--tRNA ligase n=1 Tax=Anaerorhabdus furcosa TaxID=118967 RepID=A0A1T4P767_9FIRM|nr:tyrosine--tRNA ligase [Anaerorhabdus furcosa]SJZ87056.1 tyrosyl-tRNA synthetase [Anaerorhabdus furcosa]
MNFLEELKWRGLVKDCTDLQGLEEKLKQPVTAYCGFDPTADSLHVGHLQQIMLLRRYQNAGHRPIALCGGGTGMIGDPRPTTERKLLTVDELNYNVDCLKKQLAHFIDFESGKAVLLNNYDWLGKLSLLEVLRDYGKHFNVSYMLAKDTIASRLQTGISFTEFTYTILQAIDWLKLYTEHQCELQIGGSDQWGNLVSGTDLIRKICGDKAKVFGITSPLITKSDGSKFGKSEGKNIWLDPTKTNAFEFYQFWVNTADSDIIDYLKRLSLKTPEEIMALEKSMQEAPHLREAQKALACELTELVHGGDGLVTALKITDTLFKGDIRELTATEIRQGLADVPKFKIENGVLLIDALVDSKICQSKREARELIQAGSIQVNGEKTTDLEAILTVETAMNLEFTIIKKGKKNYFICEF